MTCINLPFLDAGRQGKQLSTTSVNSSSASRTGHPPSSDDFPSLPSSVDPHARRQNTKPQVESTGYNSAVSHSSSGMDQTSKPAAVPSMKKIAAPAMSPDDFPSLPTHTARHPDKTSVKSGYMAVASLSNSAKEQLTKQASAHANIVALSMSADNFPSLSSPIEKGSQNAGMSSIKSVISSERSVSSKKPSSQNTTPESRNSSDQGAVDSSVPTVASDADFPSLPPRSAPSRPRKQKQAQPSPYAELSAAQIAAAEPLQQHEHVHAQFHATDTAAIQSPRPAEALVSSDFPSLSSRPLGLATQRSWAPVSEEPFNHGGVASLRNADLALDPSAFPALPPQVHKGGNRNDKKHNSQKLKQESSSTRCDSTLPAESSVLNLPQQPSAPTFHEPTWVHGLFS